MGRFSVHFRSFTEIYPGNIIKKFIQNAIVKINVGIIIAIN